MNTLVSALQYDQSGNLTKWESTGIGSATTIHTEYIYDDLDRLTAVVKKNPTTSANESKTEFRYDGFSRLRVTKEYTWNGTAWDLTANSEKHRIYDGMDVVQERDENNAVLATYTRDGNIGGILAKRDDNGDDYFFHYDGSGNVIGLTDENEASVAEYAYDAYGNLLSSSGTQANANLYRYSTKEYFGGIGLYNYGYRFYSPGLGRWINRDPIEEAGGLNLYVFIENSPSNAIDLYGLKKKAMVVIGDIKQTTNAPSWNPFKIPWEWYLNRPIVAAVEDEVAEVTQYLQKKGYDVKIYRQPTSELFFRDAPSHQALFWIGHSAIGQGIPIMTNEKGETGWLPPSIWAQKLGNHKFDWVTLHSCDTERADLKNALIRPGSSWWASRGAYNIQGHSDLSAKRTIGGGKWRNFAK